MAPADVEDDAAVGEHGEEDDEEDEGALGPTGEVEDRTRPSTSTG